MFGQQWMFKTPRKLTVDKSDQLTLVISKRRESYALDAALYLFLGVSVYALLLARFSSLGELVNWIGAIPSKPILWPVLLLPVLIFSSVPRYLRIAVLGEDLVFDRRKDVVLQNGKSLSELDAIASVQIRSGVIRRKYGRVTRYQLRLALRDGTKIGLEDNVSAKALSVAGEIARFLEVPLLESDE
ncbi:MAG: hypothetical protein SXV54_10555 [Chloroflexota bacterium]|nr:hypothetical protein [Chloroflexota bacterium]